MNPGSELHSVYQEWLRLAEAKGEAIRNFNWSLMTDCQKAVDELQPRILRLSRETRDEWAKEGPGHNPREVALRGVITDVFELESRNNDLLQKCRLDAGERLAQLERAGRLLRQVQRLYAPARPAAWSSFS
jgi:hypothetical protein